MMSQNKKVLILGAKASPGAPFSDEHLLTILNAEVEKGKAVGLDVEYFLVQADLKPDLEGMRKKLAEKSWEVITIGFGIRGNREATPVFEAMVNMALELVQPPPKMAFSLMPNTAVDAVQRVVSGKWFENVANAADDGSVARAQQENMRIMKDTIEAQRKVQA